MAALVIEI